MATALTQSIASDGQTTPTANLPMGGFRHTNVGNANARTTYASAADVQDATLVYLTAVAGTDTITGTAAVSMSAYVTGQRFHFISAGANTGTSVTLNINSIGAKSVTKNGSTALAVGDIPSGAVVTVCYDGTRFQIQNISTVNAAYVNVANTFTPTQIFSGAFAGKIPVPTNCTLTASVGSNALTIAIKGIDGNDPSSTNPVYVPFRNATAGTGDLTWLSLTAATSVVVSSGSTLGTTNAVPNRVWVVGFNDAGTFRLGVINCSTSTNIYPLASDVIASSTAEGGAGAADSAGVIYTGTAVTSKPMIVLGYVESTQATAGTWATTPSKVEPWISGMSLPGHWVQVATVSKTDTFTDSSAAGTWVDITGLSVSITPTSTCNRVFIQSFVSTSASTNNAVGLRLVRGSTNISVGDSAGSRPQVTTSRGQEGSLDAPPLSLSIIYLDSPASVSSQTYKIQGASLFASNFYINRGPNDNNDANHARASSSLTAAEVCG